MLGFTGFAGAPFASVGKGSILTSDVNIIGEAMLKANASAIWNSDVLLLGTADVTVMGTITGSGWVRQNPNTPEWDVTQSSDWNRIN